MDFFDFLKNNKFIILMISIIMNILLGVFGGYFFYFYLTHECVKAEDVTLVQKDVIVDNNPTDTFFVEIKGAVKNPGVYEARSDNIINDIVSLAGGFTKKAYTKNINLSRKVSSELVIYVFTESEYKKENTLIVEVPIEVPCECPSYDISDCTDNLASEIVASEEESTTNETNVSIETNKNETTSKPNASNTSSNLININTASKEELMNLSGIGESKAEDIITYRNTSGNFKTIEEIKNVSGIGDALFNKIKDSITV